MSTVAFNPAGDITVNLDGSALVAAIAAAAQASADLAAGSKTQAQTAAAIVGTFSTLLVASPDTVGIPIVLDGPGLNARQLVRLDRLLRLEVAGGIGPTTALSLGLDLSRDYAPSRYPIVHDGQRKWVELSNGEIEIYAIGAATRAFIRQLTRSPDVTSVYTTGGGRLKRSRAAIGHLARASARLIGWHYMLYGASHTERLGGPQAVVDDFRAMGVPIVATGWMGLTVDVGTGQLGDGVQTASLTRTATTTVDIQEQGASDGGQYSPEGFRATWADGDGTAGVTVVWKGKTLTLYHKANSAAFRHVTDGGAAVNTTTGTGGATGKTVVTAAAEGWHTTVFSRATNASGALEWYGLFAASALKGLTVSRCGNGGSTFSDFNAAMSTTAAQYILADIAPDQMMIDLIGNDAVAGTGGTDPAVVTANATTLVGQLRAVRPAVELLLRVMPQNGVAGVTEGRPFADYVPGLLAACDALGIEMINHGVRLPPYADEPFFYVSDMRHFEPTAGGPQILAAAERRAFWESL